jgi:hypothetical protein
MRRNSGIIGPLRSPTQTNAPGIFDTFDAYNFKKGSSWPIVYTYSLSANSGTIFENTSQSFTLTTTGYETNTTLYWTISNISTTNSDFYNSVASGSFTQSGSTNTGSFSLITAFIGNTAKSTRTFQIQIRTGSISGPVVYTSGTFSIPPITISGTSVSTTSVNEGSSFSINWTLGQLGNYTSYSVSISNSGTASLSAADFSQFYTSTTISNSGNYSLTYITSADSTTEGNETVTLSLTYNNTWVTFSTVTINDTSLTPTATVTPSTSSVNEGDSMSFSISTTNFSSGTLYWTITQVTGTINDADFSSPASAVTSGGSVTISGSSGTVNFTVAPQTLTEGAESFNLRVRLNSTVGTIIGTSSTVTINDTYTGGVANPTRTDFPTGGRAAFSWNRSSSNTTYEVPTGWTYTFPANTPTGFYYLVLWNDYSSSNTSPTASTSYRTRRVFSLHVVSTYNFANRTATAANLTTITGNGGFERIQGVRITNTTRSQLMVDVTPGSTADVQYHTNANTVMVVPGDTIEMSVLLQGPYSEWANWTHNAQ